MRHFKWIEWNLDKVSAHGLSSDDIEAAFERIYSLELRNDGSYQMYAETPSGRRIWLGDLAIRSAGRADTKRLRRTRRSCDICDYRLLIGQNNVRD